MRRRGLEFSTIPAMRSFPDRSPIGTSKTRVGIATVAVGES
jgi:hypothetical protein